MYRMHAFVCTHPRDVIICEWYLCWWYLMIFIGTSDLCLLSFQYTIWWKSLQWSNVIEFGEIYTINALTLHHIVIGTNHHVFIILSSSQDNFFLAISLKYDYKIARFKYFSMFTQFIQSFGNNNFLIALVIVKYVIWQIYIRYNKFQSLSD